MAYTRDIPFEDSSRAQRRRNSNTLETKALPKIGDVGFDPKAEDGDGDGKVQDNSAFERPALPIPSLTLSSTTGGNGSDSEDDTPKVVAPQGPVAPQPMPRTSMQVERNKDGVRVLRGKWSPLQGSDWLKDSTKEDIAEALVPYSLDDAIALMTQILCYGEIPRDKMEVLKIKAYIKQGLLKGFSGEIEWDFSPEGRLAMKNTIIKSMAESPGFEFMIRTYGAPAMMWTDPLGRDKLYARGVDANKWGIFHQGYSKKRGRQEGAGNGASIMGASLGNLVIAMNGSNPNMIADRDTGYGIESPNTGESSITGIKQDFVNNFGLSRQDTLRHEYGHWFWSFHMGSPFMYGADNMPSDVYATPARKRDRAERALFISNATGETVEQVLDRMDGLKWRFEETRAIVSSNAEKNATLAEGLGYIDIQRTAGGQINVVMLPHPDAPYKMGGLSKRGKPLWRATVGRIVEEGERRAAGESAFVWAPQDTWDTASTLAAIQDKETGFTKYSLYPLPELRGAYANSTAQELFAEAVAVFLSPKRDLWEQYLTPSMVVALSEAFNIPIKDGKLSPVWDTSRRGLASRSMQTNRPATTVDIEDIVADEKLVEALRARTKELETMNPGERRRMWTNPENGETYAIHWGAVNLEGGAIDPARSRGDENSGVFQENTRRINKDSAEPWVRETANLRRRLEADKASATDDKSKADLERRETQLKKRELIAEKLVADNYQYSSANDIGSLMLSEGYGGRYADEGAEIGGTTSWGERVPKSPRMGIHIVRIDDTNSTSLGGGEVHLIGRHTPIATLVAPRDDNRFGTNALYDIYGGWVDMAVKKDIANRSGLASRSSRVVGKGSVADRAGEELSLNDRQKAHLISQTSRMHKSFSTGEIYDMPIHPAIDEKRKELLDSMRVVTSQGGMTMIIAEPNPLLNAALPVKREWETIELPPKENVNKALNKLISSQSEEFQDADTSGLSDFTDYLESFLSGIKEQGEKIEPLPSDMEEDGYTSYVQQYYNSLRDPVGSASLLYGTDGLHDAFGHFGTGRGYDRHGEWANYLAMKDVIDNITGLDEGQRDGLHRFWFVEYGVLQLNKRGDVEELGIDDISLRRQVYGYTGPIKEITDMLDSGRNGLGEKRGSFASVNMRDIPVKQLQDVALSDVQSQLETRASRTRNQGNTRTGFASSRQAKKIAKNFKAEGTPRKTPATRAELIARAVPTSPDGLMRLIKDSPYSKGKDADDVFNLVTRMEVDWEAQAKLAKKLDKVLADSAGFEELLNEFDIPLMFVTNYGAVPSSIFEGYKDTNSRRWNSIEGEYHPESGFISFPKRIVDQDTITNSITDGPLSTEDVIRHELSHTIHAMAMGRSKKARKAYQKDTEGLLASLEQAIESAQERGEEQISLSGVQTMSDEENRLAGEISRYAQTKKSEYIAELMTHMFPGKNTKPVVLKDAHFEMLSEFLDIPVSRLRELWGKSLDSSSPFK